MRIPRLPARPWVAVAAVVAAAAILLTVIHQGNATANTGPPGTPDNTLAHLIVPDGEEPRIRVSWDAPDAEVSDYTITRADGQTFSANGAATTFSDHSVEPGTAYSYSVTSQNAHGDSPSSAEAQASVPDVPSQPESLNAEVAEIGYNDSAPSVTLTWTAATVPEVAQCEASYPLDGYTIFRSDGTDEMEIAYPDAAATSFTDTTAAFGATYTYRLVARNAIGDSPASESIVAIGTPPIPPPTGFTATINDPFDGAVNLAWSAPTEGPEVTAYLVLRYQGNDPYTGTDIPVTVSDDSVATTATDAEAPAGATHSYIVFALSADNLSNPSDTVVIRPPAPPTAIAAQAGNGAIEVSWTAPASGLPTIQYRLERRQDGTWNHLAHPTATSHRDDTVEPNVPYTYRVQHRNEYGGSAWAETRTVRLIVPPTAPTGLTSMLDGDDVILAWNQPGTGPVDGYNVRHRSENDEKWAELARTTQTSHRHDNVAADMEHWYQVQAHNEAGPGPWSNETSMTRITPPDTPSNLNAAGLGSDIVVTWTRLNAVHLNGYELEITRSDDQAEPNRHPAADATSAQITDATADVTYSFRLRAENDAGKSPWTDPTEATRIVPPAAPTGVSATADSDSITVSWTASTARFVDGYHVQYGVKDSTDTTATATRDATAASFVHSDAVEGVTYQYLVRAHNRAGNGPWSDPTEATRRNVPGIPTGVTATVSGGVIVVNWDAPTNGIASIYQVRYGVRGSETTTTASVDATNTEFVHQNPTGDTTYSYEVRARNDAGHSLWTTPVAAIRVLAPLPPTSVTAVIQDEDILVSWTAPTSGILGGYHVEHRRQGFEANWTRNEQGPTAVSLLHKEPDPGTIYEYRIRTFNDGGTSDWTEPATAIWYQGAAPPTWTSVQRFGQSNLLVLWGKSSTPGVTGYEVRQRIDGGEWIVHEPPHRRMMPAWSSDQSLHEYSVRAVIEGEKGDWSPVRRVVITRPGQPTNLSVNREGSNAVRLHWDTPEDGEPLMYRIQVDIGYGFHNDGTASGYETTHRYLHQPWNTTYRYRVVAQNHVRITGDASHVAEITMPAAPQEFNETPAGMDAVIIDGNTVKLTWNAPEVRTKYVTGYRIYRKLASDTQRIGDSFTNHVLIRQTGSTTTGYTDHTAEPGVLYEYAVAAYREGLTPQFTGISTVKAYARTWR